MESGGMSVVNFANEKIIPGDQYMCVPIICQKKKKEETERRENEGIHWPAKNNDMQRDNRGGRDTRPFSFATGSLHSGELCFMGRSIDKLVEGLDKQAPARSGNFQ